MQIIEGFDFFPLTFDDRGKLQSRDEFDALVARAKSAPATDAMFIAHGFRNDAADATRLYTHFLETFRAHLSRPEFRDVAARRFVVAGVYWPSKPFRETFSEDENATRGLRNPAEAMADARKQLDALKEDESPAHRAKLDKAIALLPKLEGDRKAQDEFVHLVLSILDHSTLDKTEGLPQIRKQSGSKVLATLSPAPAGGTRGIGDVIGTVAGARLYFVFQNDFMGCLAEPWRILAV
jgi:hypothetical protein